MKAALNVVTIIMVLMCCSQLARAGGILHFPTAIYKNKAHYVGVDPYSKRVTSQHQIKTQFIEGDVGYYGKKVSATNVKVFGINYERGKLILPTLQMGR